jgi:ABC-type glutathione transport system ATPase component
VGEHGGAVREAEASRARPWHGFDDTDGHLPRDECIEPARQSAVAVVCLLRLDGSEPFVELGDFFDRPVRTYSSGMSLRLAFAVATHADAEVLIVDEALAVGDGYFQKKSIDRITEFHQERHRDKTTLQDSA